jgi:alpha-tubulin suppressor-like RCC1 family protein
MMTAFLRPLARPPATRLLAIAAVLASALTGAVTAHAAADPSGWRQVSAGDDFTCAISEGNTLWCWGANAGGELGIDSSTSQDLPARVGLRAGWRQVSAGTSHTCAIRKDRTLWCWGSNRSGELGTGSFRDRLGPVQVGSQAVWAQVSAGDRQTCATQVDGTLWCWGSNDLGQLGTGGRTGPRTSPQQVGTAASWHQVSTGDDVTCAIRTDGTLWCWGYNAAGGVGIGRVSATQPLPVQVGTVATWQRISVGGLDACAVRTDGTLWCWGFNNDGELGTGSATDQYSPVQVGTRVGWDDVSAGQIATCALHGEPTLWCWGDNAFGQLGIGSTAGQSVPARVGTQPFWHQVSAGFSHACAIRGDRSLWCWGDNADGELGDGTTAGTDSPVQVG